MSNDRGVALVVTLGIVAILVAAALQLGKMAGGSIVLTQVESDRYQAEQWALSGVHLARMMLCADAEKNSLDSLQEPWSDPEKIGQAVAGLGLEPDHLTVRITDELSKIQVNALMSEFPGSQVNMDQNGIWERFLNLSISNDKASDTRDPVSIINSVKDWLDSGDNDTISGLSGAESDYYMGLAVPYPCANGPFNRIDELLNVKGISPDLLNPEPADETDEASGALFLGESFTVYGLDVPQSGGTRYRFHGKININTAQIAVLAAMLPEGMEDLAQDLADYREQKNEQGDNFQNPLDKGWYKKVIHLSETEEAQFDRVAGYSSDIFHVECTARQNGTGVTLVAVVKRQRQKETGKWECRLIQMERK